MAFFIPNNFKPETCKRILILLVCICCFWSPAQHYEAKSIAYNCGTSALVAGVGAIINKKSDQKWHKAFARGILGGATGGLIMYAGKKTNYLIYEQKNISYAWLSKIIFFTGNSLVENAASNTGFFSRFHFDLAFVRVDFYSASRKLMPRVLPGMLAGFVFTAVNGKFNIETSLRSGTATFFTHTIKYAPYLVGSTTGNNFLLSDTLGTGVFFHEIYAHEMVHTFQFMEQSGVNSFFTPARNKWQTKNSWFKNSNQWIHGDANYPIMLINYFLIQGGYSRALYCRNFLENEAEWLSVRRVSCPPFESH